MAISSVAIATWGWITDLMTAIWGAISSMEAAAWAAIAAMASAISSYLIFRVQRQNLLDATSPDISLSGWVRKRESPDIFRFTTIQNTGRGAAYRIFVLAQSESTAPPTYLSAVTLPILGSGATDAIDFTFRINWANALPIGPDGQKIMSLNITVVCWDSQNRRHDTRYNLVVANSETFNAFSSDVALGVRLTSRKVVTRKVWQLTLRRWVGRVPGIGRLIDPL